MKRTMFGALTMLVLALVVNLPVVNAQSKAKADVSFAFNVAQSSLPNGTYTISVVNGNEMQIQNDQTNATVFLIAQHKESLKPQNPRLVFHKYSNKYFLVEAWYGSNAGIEIPAGKLEREMRAAASKSSPHAEEVVVALR